jgi:hypothetical protein
MCLTCGVVLFLLVFNTIMLTLAVLRALHHGDTTEAPL